MFNNKKIMIPVAILCFVIILAIAYAAFTSNLNITGTGNVRDSKWKVYFSRLSEAQTTGTATVSMPTLTANATSIGDYTATVMSPGDSISFEVDVTNDGDYDALLSNVIINGTPTCKYNNDATDTSAQNVCSNLTYTIKYKGGASLIANTDILHSKETQTLVVELKYANITNSNLLPTHDIDITGLGISLTYVQSGNAKVNEDGTTPYDPYDYHVGDRIQVEGDTTNSYYYIIKNSETSDDYVVALKETVLTGEELGSYKKASYTCQFAANPHNDEPYECTYAGQILQNDIVMHPQSYNYGVLNNYMSHYLDNTKLKVVDGKKIRLITYNELQDLGFEGIDRSENTPTWLYQNFGEKDYWTMSPDGSNFVYWYCVPATGPNLNPNLIGKEKTNYSAIRPVINLYKSAIKTNN